MLILGLLINEKGAFLNNFCDHLGFQIFYIFFMISIASIIGTVTIGYCLAPLFLIAYKYTVGIRMTFGIQQRPKPSKLKIFFKSIFPAFLSIQLALVLVNNPIVENFITPAYLSDPRNIVSIPIVKLSILVPLMTGFGMGIFSPVWFLLDAGIVFTNKKKVQLLRDPIEVRSVGGWYHYIMKGYAGVAVIVSYFTFIGSFLVVTANPSIFLVLFLPLLIVLFSIPGFLLLEITAEHRIKYMQNIAKKIGIDKPLEDPLDIKLE